MSERVPGRNLGPTLPPGERRGPRRPSPESTGTSWLPGDPPVLAEHRGSLADAVADACYRWIAPAARGRDVLDVGCGAGHGSATLLAAGAGSLVGADPGEREAELATRSLGERARFIAAEPRALPLATGSFDLVVCFGLLAGATDPDAIVGELMRVLAPGGLLAVALPAQPARDPISGRQIGVARDAAGWEELLRERLGGARTHGLRAGLAAAAGTGTAGDEGLGAVGPKGAELEGAELEGARWLAGERGEERAVLALAGAGDLPDLAPTATVIGGRDLQAYRETLAAWEQRARRAEADGAAKHWELVASREAQRRLRKRLHDLEHTPMRKLVRLLRGKPAKLGPGPPIRPPEREPEPWD